MMELLRCILYLVPCNIRKMVIDMSKRSGRWKMRFPLITTPLFQVLRCFQLILIISAILIPLIPAISYAADNLEDQGNINTITKQKSDVSPKEYYLETIGLKDTSAARIRGASCDDLTGGIYHGIRPAQGFLENFSKMLFGEDATLASDATNRKNWLNEPISEKFKFYCFPYVNNVEKFLDKKVALVKEQRIELENGPMLIGYSDATGKPPINADNVPANATWSAEGYVEVKRIFTCSDQKNIFCIEMNIYSLNQKEELVQVSEVYRVFCWSCGKLQSSPQDLQSAIIFSGNLIGFAQKEYALDGGFMIPDSHLQTNDKSSAEAKAEVKARHEQLNRLLALSIQKRK